MDDDLAALLEAHVQSIDQKLDAIAKWNELAPALQTAKGEYAWMLDTLRNAPDLSDYPTEDEGLRVQVSASLEYLTNRLRLLPPPPGAWNTVSVTGTTAATTCNTVITTVSRVAPYDPYIGKWATSSLRKYQAMRDRQARSTLVGRRLAQLSERLGNLHADAVEKSLQASTGVSSPIVAAAVQRELLDQFKGKLTDLCRWGKKATYARFCENYCIDDPLLRLSFVSGQIIHDQLHGELSSVTKGRAFISQSRIAELLQLVEDHVWVITSAMDPLKTRIYFED